MLLGTIYRKYGGIEKQIKSSQGSKQINPEEGLSRKQITEFGQHGEKSGKEVGEKLVHLDFDLIISTLSVLPCF